VLQAVYDGATIVVPAIWRLEIANALVVAERRKRILPAKSTKFLQDLQQFSINVDTDGLDRIFAEVFDFARRYQRTSYDASYLELAKRRNLPFATKDDPLRKAAEELGLAMFQP
jgi:predicted nucleic acid-binding protein